MNGFDKKKITEVMEDVENGLWVVEFEEGMAPRFYADKKMDELMGIDWDITPEERFAFHHNHIHPADMKLFEDYNQKMMTGRAEATYRFIHPTLGERYVRCGGTLFEKRPGFFACHGMHTDISDLNRLEKGRVAERRLREINIHLGEQLDIIQTMAKIYNSIYYIDMETGHFVEIGANLEGVRPIIGESGSAQESLEKMCRYIIVPEQADEMREFSKLSTINERLKNRNWISHQFKGRLAGWSEGYFIAAERDENGDCKHIIWATKSIDEDKRKELAIQSELEEAIMKAKSASDAKSRFLFNMSHDIRTPMNAIIGYTNLIEKSFDNPEACFDYIKKIRKSNDFLLSLINNVLEMARIENGKVALDESVGNVYQLVLAMRAIFENPMKEKNIDFEINTNIIHPYVYGDRVKVREIYLNLLSNALKYTPEGGRISMTITELPHIKENYETMEVVISDTGIGMSEEFLPYIFDEFSRERNATDSKIQGTGLGMPIVKRIVDLMGGTIDVKSKLGEGTTFTVRIPHRIAAGVENVEKTVAIDKKVLKGKRVLLAEDNELNAEIAVAILEDAGLKVDVAEDGKKCVNMIASREVGYYDLVLMDIQMPNMNGYEAARAIRCLENEKSQIPIVAMTANAFKEDKYEALSVGMNDHLSKPIKVDKLMKVLNDILIDKKEV